MDVEDTKLFTKNEKRNGNPNTDYVYIESRRVWYSA